MKFPVRVTAAISGSQNEDLKRHAKAEGITTSNLIRRLIGLWLGYMAVEESKNEQVNN